VQYTIKEEKTKQPSAVFGIVAAIGGFGVAILLFVGLACFIRRYKISPEKDKPDFRDAEKNVRVKKIKKKQPETQALTACRTQSSDFDMSLMPASFHNVNAMTARFANNNNNNNNTNNNANNNVTSTTRIHPAIKEDDSDSSSSNMNTVTYNNIPVLNSSTKMQHTASESQWSISFEDLVLEKEIGRGAFGVVYKGRWRSNYVAVKKMGDKALSRSDFENFMKEIDVMKNLKPCNHVVQLLAVCENPFCLVLEYCEKGNLYAYLRKEEIPRETQRKIIMGIAKGMLHLHQEHIIHRDLATRNVLLSGTLEPKVSDFGMSRTVLDVQGVRGKSGVGPLRWMAPESIREHLYSPASDIWAFGITLIEMLTKDDPYGDVDIFTVSEQVASGQLVHPIPDHVSSNLRKLISKCFAFEPGERPSFEEIVHFLEKNSENF